VVSVGFYEWSVKCEPKGSNDKVWHQGAVWIVYLHRPQNLMCGCLQR